MDHHARVKASPSSSTPDTLRATCKVSRDQDMSGATLIVLTLMSIAAGAGVWMLVIAWLARLVQRFGFW